MKKFIVLFITIFLSIESVQASTIEEELQGLKANVTSLRTKVNNFENNIINKTYPVGSVYITTTYSNVEAVQNALGGTWEEYGKGRTLVSVDEDDSNFNEVNKTGGIKTTTLTTSNLPSHNHSIPALSGTAASAGAHTHSIPALSGTAASAGAHQHKQNYYTWSSTADHGAENMQIQTAFNKGTSLGAHTYGYLKTESAGAHTHTVTTNASTSGNNGAHTHNVTTVANTSGNSGSGTAFTNLQPYITVYMYKRVG